LAILNTGKPESHTAPEQSSVSILHQKAILNSTNVSIIAGDSEGLITVFNSGAEQMLGYTAEEIVGKQTPYIFHLESEVIARGLELAKKTGRPLSGLDVLVTGARNGQPEEREWTYVRKDGTHLTVNQMVTPLRDAFGTSIGFLSVAMDVTARKKAEAAARARDEHYRLIVETVGDYALIMLDASGRVTSWNTGAQRMKGYQVSEIIGQHFSRFYLPEDIERRHPETELRIAARQGRYSEQGWRVRKDGSRFFADVVIAAIHDDAGNITGFAKVVHDVTERKKTDERFQLVVEAAPSAMIMVGENGLISLVNTQSERLFGYDRQEMLGRPIEMLLPERFRSNHGTHFARFFGAPVAREMGVGRDLFGLRGDGSEVPVEISLNPIGTPDGAFVLASIIDIAARKKAEREASERTEQLRIVNKELAEFAYVASHDLKAPLRVIDNASKWLEEDLAEHLTDETRESLKLLQGRVRRMDKLLDDLLEYARIGRASDNRFAEVIGGDVLMEDVLGLLGAENFTLTVSPAFAGIQVCRMPLQQILMNLIGNAIKHHDKKKGRIEVTVEDNGDCYAFAVKDDGPGIHPRFHDEVFKMFQTLRPRDQVEGSGMGLALVRKNIEVFGGVIQLESAEGQGSTFRFTWPKQQQLHRETE
jgi:PAS domain S-box-containing protein